MKRIFTLFFMLTLLFSAFSQQSNCPPTVTDRNGNVYNTIWVGGNCWMKENLRSTLYGTQSNADHLQPVYMVYPGATSTMGYLYTWYSAVGLPQGSNATPPTAISERVQGICPNEWAIPSAIQLMSLINSGESREGNTPSYWVYNNGIMPAGTNLFNMVPSGFYNAHLERFVEYNHAGYLWTLNYNGTSSTCGIFPFDCRNSDQMSMNKNSLLSVRCVKAPPYGVEEITACDSITWNGVTRYTTGRYVANLPNDSVSTLLLTVNYTSYYTLPIVACDSYTWDLTGDTYTTSGTDVAVITNALGCDSVVTLDLEVRYSNTGVDVQNHCDSYTWIDGITYTESTNTPTFVVTNAAGCDSTVTLNLTIRKMTTGTDVQDHCDSYTWIDGITYTESTNEPTYTLTNAVGCDSVVTLNLTIRKKTYGIDVQDHCDSYTWMNGVTYTESTNDPVYTITNVAGCDSIVTLNLNIRKKNASPSQSLTEYNTYTWNGQTYTTSGIYTATLVNAVGCDSTATLDLTILYRFPITYNLNGGAIGPNDPITYVQGVGATLPIPVKQGSRFDGWYDNATFTGSPITTIGNTESGNKEFWALWTITSINVNSSISFSGSSTAYVQIPDAPALSPTSAITLEAWIYPTAWRTNRYEGTIVGKEKDNNTGYQMRCGASGTLSFAIGNGTSFPEVYSASGALTLNQWQHVAGVYDGTTLKIYKNGVLLTSYAATGAIGSNTNPLEIGRLYQYNSRYFTGKIDEVRVFNTALDAATIQTWYNKSVNNTHANYANLVSYYEFDNTTNPAIAVGTVGGNGTVAVATYGSNCSSPFITSSSVIVAPSSVSTIHPIPTHLTSMMPVVPSDTLAQILRVDVQSAIGGTISQIVLSTNGTTNPADISKARLWYTGTSTTFSTATPYGTAILNPNGTLTFNGNIPTTCGSTYYFWLTYDISSTATINNVVDAELVNCTVERLTLTPTVSAPAGNRLIADPCKYQILQIRDTYGDSWNSGTISVYKNSEVLYTNLTITVGTSTAKILDIFEYPCFANLNDTIKIVRTADGGYPGEMRVQLLDGKRNPMIVDIQPPVTPGISTIAGCYTNITTTNSANGTLTPSGIVPVIMGGSKSIIYKANTNFFSDSVIVNGINNLPARLDTIYTFNNVTTPQTLRVIFNTNIITASTGGNGTITPSGSSNVGRNGTQKYTMTPNQYYFLDSLIVDGINITDSIAGKSYTFTNVNEPHSIRVVFKTNYVTPTLITPPSIVGTPVQDNALSTLSFSGGLVQHNGIDVPGTFSWVSPSTILTLPGNYLVKFSPTDTNNYFSFTFNLNINFNISYLLAANGTSTNSYIPFDGNWLDAAQRNQMVYPSSMLTYMVGRQISSMTFYLSSPPSGAWTTIATFKVGTTTEANVATALLTAPSTTVYTGTMSVVGSNMVTITFTTPFTYTGGNLLIEFTNTAANYKSSTFYGVSQTSASRHTRSGTNTLYSFLPKIKFQLVP